jgi:protein-tyrosine phosphatase
MFVCLGNICRSPMAEAVFRHLVNEKGLSDKIFVDSCGTAGYHIGKPPHVGTKKILDSRGISYVGMKASKLEARHLKDFDGIVAMDEENLSDILRLREKNSTAWVKLLSDFVEENWVSVPDPYYTGDFELTYKLVTDGCKKLLENIIKGGLS